MVAYNGVYQIDGNKLILTIDNCPTSNPGTAHNNRLQPVEISWHPIDRAGRRLSRPQRPGLDVFAEVVWEELESRSHRSASLRTVEAAWLVPGRGRSGARGTTSPCSGRIPIRRDQGRRRPRPRRAVRHDSPRRCPLAFIDQRGPDQIEGLQRHVGGIAVDHHAAGVGIAAERHRPGARRRAGTRPGRARALVDRVFAEGADAPGRTRAGPVAIDGGTCSMVSPHTWTRRRCCRGREQKGRQAPAR